MSDPDQEMTGMKLRQIALSSAAVALVATPLGAQQITAGALRDSAPVSSANDLGGESSLVFILGIATVAAAIVFLSEDDDPVSP